MFPSALSYQVPPRLLPLGVSHLVHTIISFSTPSLLHSCLLSQPVLVSPLGASLRSQDLPFLMCRSPPCLKKPISPFKTVEVLFHPFLCSCVSPVSPSFSCISINPSCIFFLPWCWSLFLSPGTCLYLMLSYLTALFPFHFSKSSLGFLTRLGPLPALPDRLS